MNIDKDRIAVQYLFESEPEQTWQPQDICRTLGFRGKQVKQLQSLLRQMIVDGAIVELRPNVFGLGKPADLVTGRLTLVRSGAGFVANKVAGDTVWIKSEDMGVALPGDTVTVRLYHAEDDEVRGKVIRIVERSARDIVGTLFTTGRFLYVVPLDPVYRQDFAVPDVHGAKEGDRVVVRFTNWPNRHVAPEGEIVDVIGPADQPSLDTTVICRQYDLPGDFPEEVIREAEAVAGRLAKPGKRLDLRDTYILTVDPVKARDFDDALSLGHDDQDRRVLGVHIADVSHFVRPGSALDTEAYERATSIYLVDKVIPMLPEQLSNGVCSLHPDEDRLCFSAFLTFDASGRAVERHFAKTLIRSRLRLNYEQALAILEDRPPEGLAMVPVEAAALLKETHTLSRQLRQKRFQAGALDLEVPECEVLIDPSGRMSGVRISPTDHAHQLIEECMVAANEAVATELATRGIRILSRLHEAPDPDKMEELQAGLAMLGFHPGDLTDPKRLARFLADTADHPLRFHAHTLVLRSMKRALYSADKAGHFGLAKRYYSHFTSPIRRYPDFVLHRQLAAFVADEEGRGALPTAYLKAAAEQSTAREQRADDASRALIEIKKFRFLQQQLDDQKPIIYDAVVSRVTNFGMFVDVTEIQVAGLVHISTISQQFVRHQSANDTLSVAGDVYRVGTKLRVYVSKVDFNQRRADFSLAREERKGAKPEAKRTDRDGRYGIVPASRERAAGGASGGGGRGRPAQPAAQQGGPRLADDRPRGGRSSSSGARPGGSRPGGTGAGQSRGRKRR
jgi:ribonuclease R